MDIEQILYLKSVTKLTGAIHEWQTLQLKKWPLLIPGVIKGSFDIDYDTHEIYYLFETNSKFNPKDKFSANVLKSLTKWCQFILWDDTQVTWDNKILKKKKTSSRLKSTGGKNVKSKKPTKRTRK